MCYPDREDYITLLFQFLEEFEASDTCNPTSSVEVTRKSTPTGVP